MISYPLFVIFAIEMYLQKGIGIDFCFRSKIGRKGRVDIEKG